MTSKRRRRHQQSADAAQHSRAQAAANLQSSLSLLFCSSFDGCRRAGFHRVLIDCRCLRFIAIGTIAFSIAGAGGDDDTLMSTAVRFPAQRGENTSEFLSSRPNH
uniref:Uncharacterized protein n=1 Tax=Lactuca sativa TaxID=4236 RepID=A0A9R1VKJ3_LACSA|nr:hypothetical protein LSAT_V11C500276100 [Lactuca sativa]